MNDNDTAVLCFYCDDVNDVACHHTELTPQEYRSRLFSRMFDMYVKSNDTAGIVNYCIKMEAEGTPRFAHFIAQEKYLSAVKLLGNNIMEK